MTAPTPSSFRPVFAALMPHPPIVVPAVGGGRCRECAATQDACREVARRLVEHRPDRLILVSPHSPRPERGLGIWPGPRLRGDLGDFGARRTAVDLPAGETAAAALAAAAEDAGVELRRLPADRLDHGAVVPLWFLVEAGWKGPTTVLAPPWPGGGDPVRLGRLVAEAGARLGGRTALIASGDMSHRTRPGAPAGHHPAAADHDREVCARIAAGRPLAVADLDPELRRLAAEDVVETTTLVAAAAGDAVGCEVLSYEDPFGVGYLVAVLRDPAAATGLNRLPAVAREAIRARLEGRSPRDLPPARGELARRAAVFVTLRRRDDGALRGCIGSLEPLHSDLVAETADRAVAAAFSDPRFRPVSAEELPHLAIEVSVLGRREEVAGLEDLDPTRYGVVVTGPGGRRGVLLPAIEGVETAAEQVAIARRKAGIGPAEPVRLERFPVEKAAEEEPPPRP
ncbi:MAG: AmmeMemoRadiSam system protein A [Planctomycetota bacterium]|nr:MAG: AmmeMemoRadiSam system protein A [Planctomycetota bacterium]